MGRCVAQRDAVIFSWDPGDGEGWLYEEVERGGEGLCGQYPNLVFTPAGEAVVTWRCSRPEGGGNEFSYRLEAAVRAPLR